MERLTTTNGHIWKCVDCIEESNCYGDICCNEISNVIQKLSEYEDIGCTPEQLKQIDKWYAEMCRELGEYKRLEEQGLILRLPLPEGTQVYCIGSCGEICDDYSTDCEVCGEHEVVFTTSFDRNMIEQFGKTVFANEEEAEQALADMKGETE